MKKAILIILAVFFAFMLPGCPAEPQIVYRDRQETDPGAGTGTTPDPDIVAARSALGELIAAGNQLQQADFTSETWHPFSSALRNSTLAYNFAGSSLISLNNAFATLQNAKSGLVTMAEQTFNDERNALHWTIHNATMIDESVHTPETWAPFATALADAIRALETATTAEPLATARVNLLNAQASLMLTPCPQLVREEGFRDLIRELAQRQLDPEHAQAMVDYQISGGWPDPMRGVRGRHLYLLNESIHEANPYLAVDISGHTYQSRHTNKLKEIDFTQITVRRNEFPISFRNRHNSRIDTQFNHRDYVRSIFGLNIGEPQNMFGPRDADCICAPRAFGAESIFTPGPFADVQDAEFEYVQGQE